MMKGKILLSFVFAIVIGMMLILPMTSAYNLEQTLGLETTDGSVNAIGAYKFSAYNFTASSAYNITNVSIYVSTVSGLASITNAGLYKINSTNGVNVSSLLGNSTNTINSFSVGSTYNFSFNNIPLESGQKYAIVFWASGSANFIRVGEEICPDGYSWQSGANVNSISFNVMSQVCNVNIKIYSSSLQYGSKDNPYLIYDWTDLFDMRTRSDSYPYYVLMNNLSSANIDYAGIGDSWSASDFDGSFNGNNSVIYNLIGSGLFGSIGDTNPNTLIYNLGISNASSTGGMIGILANYMPNGNVSNCFTTGEVIGSGIGNYAGGLIGLSKGNIYNSYSIVNVSGSSGIISVGGLVGSLDSVGKIYNSYSSGMILSSMFSGGLVGLSSGTVSNSYYDTNTSGQQDSNCGLPKTTLEMTNISTFNNWNISLTKNVFSNNIYPNLAWQNKSNSYLWLLIDNVVPSISFVSPTPSNNTLTSYLSNNITIAINSYDINVINYTNFSIYNSTRELIYNQFNTTGNINYRFNPPGFGKYYYNATSYDIAGNYNSTETREITFTDFNFGLCNTTMTVPYLNISFKDEKYDNIIGAQIKNLVAQYYIFDKSFNKTYTLTNTTSNYNYVFCASPSYIPYNMSISFDYTNSSYNQKSYSSGLISLSNVTTNLELTLLNVADSHLVSFQTLDSSSTPIANVRVDIYTTSGLTSSLVSSKYTDTTGVFGIGLSNDITYTIFYSKEGYQNYTQTVQPVLSSYSVYMTAVSSGATGGGAGGAGSASGGGSYIPQSNISWIFYHTPNMWFFNSSQSVKSFFNVSTSDTHYGGSRIEVWTNSTYKLNWTATNKSIGNVTSLSLNQSFGNYTALIFKYFIYNSSSITDYHQVYTETFRVVNINESQYTLAKGIKSWGNYTIAEGFEESFGTAWWVFFWLCIIVGVFCITTGVELINPMAISIGFTMALGVISYAGLIYVPGMPTEFMRKYSILLVTALFNIGHIASIWRER